VDESGTVLQFQKFYQTMRILLIQGSLRMVAMSGSTTAHTNLRNLLQNDDRMGRTDCARRLFWCRRGSDKAESTIVDAQQFTGDEYIVPIHNTIIDVRLNFWSMLFHTRCTMPVR